MTTTQQDTKERLTDFIMFSERKFAGDLLPLLHTLGLAFSGYLLLERLCSLGDHRMGEISNFLGHSTAATTSTIDRLEEMGYVQRRGIRGDRRAVKVQATRKAVQLVERRRGDILASLEEIMREYGLESVGQVMRHAEEE